ncbi:MAG TPA: hypothetical protein VHC42_05170 [Rhizomicrobium sp.]|nr:hypothetical protein [Rhizomicrobium sp.]
MVTRALLVTLGLLHLVNGALMLAAPGLWYVMVPGVTDTGPMNQHFVYDVGMAFVASGAMLALGAKKGRSAAMLACAGAVWPALHALVHIHGWIAMGLPTGTGVAVSEALGVVGLAALGVILAWLRMRGEPA